MNEKEKNVFKSLAQSGEGEVLRGYIMRLRDELSEEVVDDPKADKAELSGARMARLKLKELADRLVPRGTIPVSINDFK